MQRSAVNAKPRAGRRTVIAEGKFVNFVRRGRWEYAERRGCAACVGIVALTPKREIILVEQHRPPVDAPVIEVPAGLVGDTRAFRGESLETAARRELLEETGYEASRWVPLLSSVGGVGGVVSAGISDETIQLFLALELKRVAKGGGDASEAITVHRVALAKLSVWLLRQQRRGARVDLKIFAGLELARPYL